MENIIWTDRVRNEEVSQRGKGERSIIHRVKRRNANWIGRILRRNCLLKHVVDGEIKGRLEVAGRRGTGRKQQLDDLEEKRGCWKLKGEPLYHMVESSLWKRLWMMVVAVVVVVTVRR
jgi:hypothetical protein